MWSYSLGLLTKIIVHLNIIHKSNIIDNIHTIHTGVNFFP